MRFSAVNSPNTTMDVKTSAVDDVVVGQDNKPGAQQPQHGITRLVSSCNLQLAYALQFVKNIIAYTALAPSFQTDP